MADKYQSTLLPSELTVEENRKAVLDLLAKINAEASSTSDQFAIVNAAPTRPLTAALTDNATVSLGRTVGTKTILIPVAFLKASAAGPFVLTLTSGVSGTSTVQVPIAASGDTILSGPLLFDVYVDSSGNVISKDWEIAVVNSLGVYRCAMNGTLVQRPLPGVVSINLHANTVSFATVTFYHSNATPLVFPRPFTDVSTTVVFNPGVGSYPVNFYSTTLTTLGFSYYVWSLDPADNMTTQLKYTAEGRWRT